MSVQPKEDAAVARKPASSPADPIWEMPPSHPVLDALERVMPDLPTLGLLMVLFVMYLVCTGADFGPSSDENAAMQQADEAAVHAIGYVPY